MVLDDTNNMPLMEGESDSDESITKEPGTEQQENDSDTDIEVSRKLVVKPWRI